MEIKHYRIEVLTHPGTGLLVATSPDLKGFMAHANDFDGLRGRVLTALRALMEARGYHVDDVRLIGDEPVGEFERSSFEVETALAA